MGARQLMVFGLGPMGCIPLQRVLSTSGGCQEKTNKLAVSFNAAASKLLDKMSSALANASYTFGDNYDVVNDVITNPSKFGTLTCSNSFLLIFFYSYSIFFMQTKGSLKFNCFQDLRTLTPHVAHSGVLGLHSHVYLHQHCVKTGANTCSGMNTTHQMLRTSWLPMNSSRNLGFCKLIQQIPLPLHLHLLLNHPQTQRAKLLCQCFKHLYTITFDGNGNSICVFVLV